MKKSLAISLMLTSSAVFADKLSVTYDTAKAANCKVSLQYFDGDKNRITCEATDQGTYRSAGSTATLTCSGDVGHLDDSGSAIFVSSNCADTIKGLRAEKSKTRKKKKKSKSVGRFWAKDSDKSGIKNKVSAETTIDDCYKRVSIYGDRVRSLLNTKIVWDQSCKLTTLK